MLVQVIKFEIRNFKNGSAEQFVVENTADNYMLIAQQKNTRDIHFDQMLDFQFARERYCPLFLDFGNAVLDAFDNNADEMVDEMVGAF